MIYNVYCVHDAAVGFLRPAIDQNDAVTMRHFQAMVNESPEMMMKPEDFTLYRIGSFDTDTGAISGCPAELVCSASDFVRKRGKNNG